jgi:hypothetical protein
MATVLLNLWNDESGFIVSGELILISTVGVLSMIVGLSEVSNAINNELEDVASAFGSVNQSYRYSGLTGHAGLSDSGSFQDGLDFCDGSNSIGSTSPSQEVAMGLQ